MPYEVVQKLQTTPISLAALSCSAVYVLCSMRNAYAYALHPSASAPLLFLIAPFVSSPSSPPHYSRPFPSSLFSFVFIHQSVTVKAERWADGILKMCGPVIRPFARLFLLCTFIEDAFRMAFQWDVQVRHAVGAVVTASLQCECPWQHSAVSQGKSCVIEPNSSCVRVHGAYGSGRCLLAKTCRMLTPHLLLLLTPRPPLPPPLPPQGNTRVVRVASRTLGRQLVCCLQPRVPSLPLRHPAPQRCGRRPKRYVLCCVKVHTGPPACIVRMCVCARVCEKLGGWGLPISLRAHTAKHFDGALPHHTASRSCIAILC